MRQDKHRIRASEAPDAPSLASISKPRPPARRSVRPRRRLSTDARRRQLIETAMRVFAQFGFTGATTRRIAEAAGVTEAVIFQHFADKDALYAAILAHKATEAKTDQWLASLEQMRQGGDDAAVLRAIFERVIARHEQDPHCLRLMVYSALENHAMSRGMQEAQSRRLIQFLEGFVLEGQRAGRFRGGSPGVLARAILGMPVYHVFQMRLFRSAPDVEREELIELGVAFTLAGLARVDGDGHRRASRNGHEAPDARNREAESGKGRNTAEAATRTLHESRKVQRRSRRVIGTRKEHTC